MNFSADCRDRLAVIDQQLEERWRLLQQLEIDGADRTDLERHKTVYEKLKIKQVRDTALILSFF